MKFLSYVSRKDAKALSFLAETIEIVNTRKKQGRLSVYVFGFLILNLVFAPIVRASTGDVLSKGQSYALALLGLVTFSLFVYLFVVIFQPEKF